MGSVLRYVAAVGIAIPLAFAGPPMSRVTIHVTAAETGKPVDRASVVLKFVSGRAPLKMYKKISDTWETRTNQDGNAILPPIPQGTVRLQVIAANFQTFGKLMDVDAEAKTLDVALNPPQAQYTVK